MSLTNQSWSERLTQGYLALRSGSTAEAAAIFAYVATKAPPDMARVARMEIRARFLEKALSPSSDEHAVVFEQVLERAFGGLDQDVKDLLRQACRTVLNDLEQEGRLIVLGPLFMTRYAFGQKKLRLIGLLSESEKGVMEWGKALDFIVGGGKGSLVGRQEWRKVSRLLREGGALSCTSARVQVVSRLRPIDLVYEWISLTSKPIQVHSHLSAATGTKGVLDPGTFDAAIKDGRFRAFGPYLWLESLAAEIEDRWARALESARGVVNLRTWCLSNLPSNPDSRGRTLLMGFVDLVEQHLGQLARARGFEQLGQGIWGKPAAFMDYVAQHIARLKKVDVTVADLKEGLGLRGARLSGGVLWKMSRLLADAGYVRIGLGFVHSGKVSASVGALIASGVKEPVAWPDVEAHLAKAARIQLRRDDLKKVLLGDERFVLTPEGIYSRERRASSDEIHKAALMTMEEAGYASEAAICARVEQEFAKIATPTDVYASLKEDHLFTRVFGGWALAPEFNWIMATRARLVESPPNAWARGMIGWVHPETEGALVTSAEREAAGRDSRNEGLNGATFYMTQSDLLHSRLKIYRPLQSLFPRGRFVAFFTVPSGPSVRVWGDNNASLIQFPLGFLTSLGLSHGDEVRITKCEGWPPVYEISPTGKCDAEMREDGSRLASRISQAVQNAEGGPGSAIEAVLEETGVPMSACEIHDALALGGLRLEHNAIVSHVRSYSYFVRAGRGFYSLDQERRRQYLLRIAELEAHVRTLKNEVKQAETMVLAFRSENARLKNENREMRNRLSSLEIDRLRSGEALQNAKKAIEHLNAQLKAATKQNAEVSQRLSLAESRVEELEAENRRLRREIEKPFWRKLVDSILRVFRPVYERRGISA